MWTCGALVGRICVRVYIYIHTYICTHTINIYACIPMYRYVCVYMHTYRWFPVFIQIYIYIYVAYIYIYGFRAFLCCLLILLNFL